MMDTILGSIGAILGKWLLQLFWNSSIGDFFQAYSPIGIVYGMAGGWNNGELATPDYSNPAGYINDIISNNKLTNLIFVSSGSSGNSYLTIVIDYLFILFSAVAAIIFLGGIVYAGMRFGAKDFFKSTFTDLYQTIIDMALAIFALFNLGTIVGFLLRINGLLLQTFGEAMGNIRVDDSRSLFQFIAQGPGIDMLNNVSGSEIELTPVLLIILLFAALSLGLSCYFLFYYYMRQVIFVILMGIAPIHIASYVFNSRKQYTIAWIKDLVGLIFIQSIHALTLFICGTIMFATVGSNSDAEIDSASFIAMLLIPIIMYLAVLPVARTIASQFGLASNMLDTVHSSVSSTGLALGAVVASATAAAVTGGASAALGVGANALGSKGRSPVGQQQLIDEDGNVITSEDAQAVESEQDFSSKAKTIAMMGVGGKFVGQVMGAGIGVTAMGASPIGAFFGSNIGGKVGEGTLQALGYTAAEAKEAFGAETSLDDSLPSGADKVNDLNATNMAERLNELPADEDINKEGLENVTNSFNDDRINSLKNSITSGNFASSSDIHAATDDILSQYQSGADFDEQQYQEFLKDNGLEDTAENRLQFENQPIDQAYLANKALAVGFDNDSYQAENFDNFKSNYLLENPDASEEDVELAWNKHNSAAMNDLHEDLQAAVQKGTEQAGAVTTNQMDPIDLKKVQEVRESAEIQFEEDSKAAFINNAMAKDGKSLESAQQEWEQYQRSEEFQTAKTQFGEQEAGKAYSQVGKGFASENHVDQKGNPLYESSIVDANKVAKFTEDNLDNTGSAKYASEDLKNQMVGGVSNVDGKPLFRETAMGNRAIDAGLQNQIYRQQSWNNTIAQNPELARDVNSLQKEFGSDVNSIAARNVQSDSLSLADKMRIKTETGLSNVGSRLSQRISPSSDNLTADQIYDREQGYNKRGTFFAGLAGSFTGASAAYQMRSDRIQRNLATNPYTTMQDSQTMEPGEINNFVEKQIDENGRAFIPKGNLRVRTTNTEQFVEAKGADGSNRIVSRMRSGDSSLKNGQVVYTDLDIKDGMIVPATGTQGSPSSYMIDNSGGKRQFEGQLRRNISGLFSRDSNQSTAQFNGNLFSNKYKIADPYLETAPIAIEEIGSKYSGIRYEASRAESVITAHDSATNKRVRLSPVYKGIADLDNNVKLVQDLDIENYKFTSGGKPQFRSLQGHKINSERMEAISNSIMMSGQLDTMLENMMPFTTVNERNQRANARMPLSVRSLRGG